MNFYIKTSVKPSTIQPYLKHYMNTFNKLYIPDKKLLEILHKDYAVSFKGLSSKIIKQVRVEQCSKNLVRIYFLNCNIKNHQINNILSLLEYGCLDIKPARLISKLMSASIAATKRAIGDI